MKSSIRIASSHGNFRDAMIVKSADIVKISPRYRERTGEKAGRYCHDIATSEKAIRYRQDVARGPVSMAEIRRIQDALYR